MSEKDKDEAKANPESVLEFPRSEAAEERRLRESTEAQEVHAEADYILPH